MAKSTSFQHYLGIYIMYRPVMAQKPFLRTQILDEFFLVCIYAGTKKRRFERGSFSNFHEFLGTREPWDFDQKMPIARSISTLEA